MEYFGVEHFRMIEMEYREAGRKDALSGINRAERIKQDIITKVSTIIDTNLATLLATVLVSYYEKGRQEVAYAAG